MPKLSKKAKTSKQKIIEAQKDAQALELRLRGYSYAKIGRAMGTSKVMPFYRIKRILGEMIETNTEDANEVLRIEIERLDIMQSVLAERVKGGDVKAIDRWLVIHEKRMKLYGLDKRKVEISGPDGGPIQTLDVPSSLAALSKEMDVEGKKILLKLLKHMTPEG